MSKALLQGSASDVSTSEMDKYEMIGKVGEGTFGEVFKAKHIETGRIVALKKIRIRNLEQGIPKNLLRWFCESRLVVQQSLRREMQSLEKIQHPNVGAASRRNTHWTLFRAGH